MKNFKYNYKKNKFRNSSDRNFKRNGSSQKFNVGFSDISEFKRKKINRNTNATKLIEKYIELAKEAASNGDKILSENYYQHADHFIRVSEKEISIKKDNQQKEPVNIAIDNNDALKTDVK